MKNIRIGKDIAISWKIFTNGQVISLYGRDLKLILTTPQRLKQELELVVTDNVVSATYKGTQQKTLGGYSLTLWENFGKDRQTAVDACNAFTLVPTTCSEGGTDEGLDTETVELSGNMDIFTSGESIGIPDAPSDGKTYGRNNREWVAIQGGGGVSAQFSDNVLLFGQTGAMFNNNILII